jgi:hypothetical protein
MRKGESAMRSGIKALGYSGFIFVSLFLLLLALEKGTSMAESLQRDGAHVDLVVREITVSPARAHVGDTIRIEMAWQYWGDMISNYYDTTTTEVLANGKVVAGKPFVYNFGAQLGDEYRETFLWDTKGMAPGAYRIRGRVPLRLDATPYDNFLEVKEPVILVPQGAAFPSGEEGGGTVVGKNRFWLER